ncbi:MAG: sensor histidine kinase [Lachnospiraceae bacterium]|nr:sensor histidine kinase [Lachnospiraceae bacterium]
MKVLNYIKDKLWVYVIKAAAMTAIMIFLLAYKVEGQAICVVTVIFSMTVFFSELWDYVRKKGFFDQLATSLEELNKKYLLPELLPQPGFYEGELLSEALSECGKSMTENVAEYRKQSREFREYIEMWVHEAKIPVASLRLMCHNNADADKKMITQLKRIDDNIENVLYYARSENAEKDYVIKEVSLQRVFGSVAVRNRESLQLVEAEIETSGLDVTVMTDSKWMEFIFGQLMANSLKYMAPERSFVLNVYAENHDDQVVFHFRDNGVGIPAADIPYVFDKSFTGSNGRKDTRSTGMGLYIVRNLCERLGHRVHIESEQGSFTDVQIFFSRNNFYKMD